MNAPRPYRPETRLAAKLRSGRGAAFLYGTTPPRLGTPPEVVLGASEKLAERVARLPADGFLVYDIQDESGRSGAPRPFPFAGTIDARRYVRLLGELTGRDSVCYKCIGTLTEREWRGWLDETALEYGIVSLALVGRPSSRGAPYPMSLARAFEIARAHPARFALGGVAIAEREGEGARMLEKSRHGCEYFVSQTVYEAAASIRMLSGYAQACREHGVAPGRVVLSFAPCGRERTIAFMKWLGISIPAKVEESILTAQAPLVRSLEICRANLRLILDSSGAKEVPLGVSAESVSINRDEIDASVDLFFALREGLAGSRELSSA